MNALRRGYDKLLFGGMAAAAGLIALMVLIVAGDVLLRNLGWANLPWAVEAAEYILFLSTFLAAPWALHKGVHVHVDVVTRGLPPRGRALADLAAGSVGLLVSVFLLVYGIRTAFEAWYLGALIFKEWIVPEWWLLSVIPLTGALLTVESLLHISGYRSPRDERGREPLARDGF